MKTEAELDAAADRLMKLAKDDRLIPGIYNYCDRWCERCPQTTRRLNFTLARAPVETGETSGKRDPENRKFWDDLSVTFALTAHMIRRTAEQRRIDLDFPECMAVAEAEERALDRRAARRKCATSDGGGLRKSAGVLPGRLPQAMQAAEREFPQARAFRRPGLD